MLNGEQPEAFAQEVGEAGTDTTLLTQPQFPGRPRESKWLGILVLRRTEVGRECVQSERRGANRGLSHGEGVLARARAVRPRAMPRTQKGRTQTQRTPRRQLAHCAVFDTTLNRTPSLIHSYIHTFVHSYIHTAPNTRSAAQQSVARDARVHHTHVCTAAVCAGSFRVLLPPRPTSLV